MDRQLPMAALLPTALLAAALSARADELTFERLHADPPVAGPVARGVQVAPDGARVTYLQPRPDNRDVLDLWQIETASGAAGILLRQEDLIAGTVELTAEEEARRQRLRIREGGITTYAYDDSGKRLLIPLAGNLYIYELESRELTEITGDTRLNPKLSPRGDRVAFVRDRNVWVRDLRTGDETRMTSATGASTINGLAEFVAQEEMGRLDGFWWSPDGRRIAYTQYDEAAVQILERVAIGGDGATLTEQRYPLAGTTNVAIRVGIVDIADGTTQWAELGADTDIYIPRVQWDSDGSRLYVEREPRSQQRLDLLAIDPADGSATILVTETAATSWINLQDDLKPLPDGRFLWSSERSGYRHIYLYDADGRDAIALTSGDWVVDGIACVDGRAERVYFTGWREDPLARDLYRIGFDGATPGRPERVTERDGTHSIAAARDCSLYVDTYSAPDQPPQTSIHDGKGTRIRWLLENALDTSHPYAPFLDSHVLPEFGTIAADDGSMLYYSLHRPPDPAPPAGYPAIVMVYGGPGVQNVRRAWGSLVTQIYVDAGYAVFTLDNRGAARRGVRFESWLHGRLGEVETRDQLTGIRFLAALPWVDGSRIGVKGWSYGGYMTLMLLARSGGAVKAAEAGAPVTDWRLYDTHYTERYLGLPAANASGYDRSSVFPYLTGIEGSLLLIHGMADDNVFFTNSTKLMQALQHANIPFDLMTYPGETHFIRNRESQLHRDLTGLRFFDRSLAP